MEKKNFNNKNTKIKDLLKKGTINKKHIITLLIVIVLIVSIVFITNRHKDLKTITLETHANEISEWDYEFKDKGIVKLYDKKRSGDIEGKTAEGLIIEKYTFKALKKGKTIIKFTFLNKKNGSFGEIKEYYVTVDKNLKLTIKEKKENISDSF